jgi:hypothetical protein
MTEHVDVFGSEPRRLASMLGEHWDVEENWGLDEMQAILRHQLAAPINSELTVGSAAAIAGWTRSGGRFPMTFAELLQCEDPPVCLLKLVKDYAKGRLADRGRLFPREIASALYFASVVVARTRCGESISRLSDSEIMKGVGWLLEQPWLDARTRRLMLEGRRALGEGGMEDGM